MVEPWHQEPGLTIWHSDCLDVLRQLPDDSVDSVCTDPPYGLEFMGKAWDSFGRDTGNGYREAPRINDRGGEGFPGHRGAAVNSFQAGAPFQRWCEQWAAECLRVLKPGGHMLAFGGTRTWHRLACAVEDAGFEVRDSIAWLYGSGFPKSLDVSKAIDKAAGAEREVIGTKLGQPGYSLAPDLGRGVYSPDGRSSEVECAVTAPTTDAARTWQGWGTALKPAFEPVVVARKPLSGTVAANVLTYGTGALNIDACRVSAGTPDGKTRELAGEASRGARYAEDGRDFHATPGPRGGDAAGRWPANVVLSDDQAAELDRQSGTSVSGVQTKPTGRGGIWTTNQGQAPAGPQYGDSGGASRFFPTFRYQAKAPTRERPKVDGVAHPTVKPLELMRWLVRLVTPPGGTVLEPFAGSGATVEACLLEGFQCIAIEREEDYLPLIVQRVLRASAPPSAPDATQLHLGE